ncbi:MAG: hypothetical protein LBD25_00515 [Coriobacteriales bacterium]|jgi:hypothetical protein|nr:hypothetical protein [Coriobacteriales bacterium]
MFQNDYLMRMILQLVEALRRSMNKEHQTRDEELSDLERSIGDAVDMDPDLFLSLAPESMVSVLQIGEFDPGLAGLVVRSLYYEADLLYQNGNKPAADLRRAQADALARAYGVDADIASASPDALEEYFRQREAESEGGLPDPLADLGDSGDLFMAPTHERSAADLGIDDSYASDVHDGSYTFADDDRGGGTERV